LASPTKLLHGFPFFWLDKEGFVRLECPDLLGEFVQ
jgi:hypothetical protein